jgi:hypothetical protein
VLNTGVFDVLVSIFVESIMGTDVVIVVGTGVAVFLISTL